MFKRVLIVPLIFLFIGILTLNDYGINWDEPIHFNRGQGYLYYFLTGKIEQDEPISSRPSFFNGYDVKALYDWDGGHPVTSDILAAISNFIFYQKLGIIGDIQGYHLYNLATATLSILIVSVFAYKTYGFFASLVASLILATYPLFFAESHFNIKDPPETAFFALTIFSFWKSLERGNWRWLLLSAVAAGFALGTKFNILFLPFILVPYIVLRYASVIRGDWNKIKTSLKKIPAKYAIVLVLFPVISFVIFFGTWPFLWDNPRENFLHVVGYYKDIATGFDYQPQQYTVGGFNFYAPFWILITTPPIVLILAIAGVISALVKDDKTKVNKLWLLWFIVPIVRVMFPGTTIYGGVRQVMEFLPAMALLSGAGFFYLTERLKNITVITKYQALLITIISIILFVPLIHFHPNENVYFNQLIGGLSGARDKNIPSWGNSYGNAYWQAIQWINKNVPENSKLALVQGTGQNVPLIQLRDDIEFSGTNWSGINRDGEYLMELTYESSRRAYPYVWEYIEAFLEPVYEVKADGVAIAKVWENNLDYTQSAMRRKEIIYPPKNIKWGKGSFTVDMGTVLQLTRIIIRDSNRENCSKSGDIELSVDGKTWGREQEKLNTEQVLHTLDFAGGVNFFFAAKEARFIRLTLVENSCFSSPTEVVVYALE